MPPDKPFRLDSRAFDDLMLGGRGAFRFTQDSPVLPDVWTAYAAKPGEPLDLLLTPHDDSGPGELALALRDRLPKDARPRLAYTGTYVAATLTLEQLIVAAIPLSKWWQRAPEKRGQRDDRAWFATLLGAFRVMQREGGLIAVEEEERARQREERRRRGRGAERAPGEQPAEEGAPRVTLAELRKEGEKLLTTAKITTPDKPVLWQVARNREAEIALRDSRRTVKADAAATLFHIDCGDLAWAVIDSGIDATHRAFCVRDKKGKPARGATSNSRVAATYDFTRLRRAQAYAFSGEEPEDDPELLKLLRAHEALLQEMSDDLSNKRPLDWNALEPLLRIPHDDDAYVKPPLDHGTHVAGIIAGDWPEEGLVGVCPSLKLYDLRVVRPDDLKADEFAVNAALQFIDHINGFGRRMIVHGANVSMSLRHAVDSFACGETPVCREANRLVSSGVVVVAAAGNLGRAEYVLAGKTTEGYRTISITDPGNAERVITVGATHRANPHTYGVSYFSSRGPTGDGRAKPDLVAPGEKITAPIPGDLSDEKDGTSQAAPHVSGAAALLLGRHRELIGDPDRVKRVLCTTATDLGREPAFQGAGLVDALRALEEL
jgi:serine protease AprX